MICAYSRKIINTCQVFFELVMVTELNVSFQIPILLATCSSHFSLESFINEYQLI